MEGKGEEGEKRGGEGGEGGRRNWKGRWKGGG